jgi:hypothetical protein
MDFTTYEPRISELEAGGGGGGDSDFSTATVTFVMTNYANGYTGSFNIINVRGNNDILSSMFIVDTPSRSAQAVLYKGKAQTGSGDITSVEGNATLDDGDVEITGDCTIYFTGYGM